MQDEVKATASLYIGANSLKIEGNEAFVERMVDKLGVVDLMHKIDFTGNDEVGGAERLASDGGQPDGKLLIGPKGDNLAFAEFDEVYAETDAGFSIIADVEENTIAKTARNYILLHLYGCYLQGKFEVSDEDIRAVCVTHACYDPGNFAHHIKGLGSKVIRIGGARTYNLKLTAPGIRAAKQFAADVQKRAMSQ